jgi:hypothetical protein
LAAPLYTNWLQYDSGNAAYWTTVTCITGTTKLAQDPNLIHGTTVQMTWSRTTPAGVREDVALTDFHFGSSAVAGGYSHLTSAEMGSIETLLDAMWTTLKTNYQSHWILSGYVWRDYGADFPLGKTGLSKPGPARRITARTVAGTSAGTPLADQTSQNVTFRTASRKHWGRIYLPAASSGILDQYGHIASASVDAFAAAVHTMINGANALSPAIDTFVWSAKNRGQFAINELRMDDVPDVIRRRRPKQKNYFKSYTS